MHVNLMVPIENMQKSPRRMLEIIAKGLGMSPTCFEMKTRVREIAEMRFIAAALLRQNYPALTLQDIAKLFGGQDHTSIMSGLDRARNLIYSGDTRFIQKYNMALKSVNEWLKKTA
jgi:chromosomal replication initiation ATPase DnaA